MHAANAFTFARANRLVCDITQLLEDFCPRAIALDIEANCANPDLVGERAESFAAQWKGKADAMRNVRLFLEDSSIYKVCWFNLYVSWALATSQCHVFDFCMQDHTHSF